jgi:hypothetical protein
MKQLDKPVYAVNRRRFKERYDDLTRHARIFSK